MIITLVFITGAPGLYVKEIYHNVEIACKELLFALPKREEVHNAVHYMIDLQKQHLDIVDGMDDIHIVPQKLSKNKSAPKFLLWGVWAHAGKATGGKKCLGLQIIIRMILIESSILFCFMCW